MATRARHLNDRTHSSGAPDGLLSAAIEAADLCTAVMVGPEFRYVFVNPAFQALRPDVPMVGRRYREVFPEAVAVGAEERFRQVLETGEPWIMERYFAPIAGLPDAHWTGEAIRLDEASPEGAVAVFARNVTEQWRMETALARTEAALRASNEKLARTIDSITDGVAVLDREWRYTFVSERAGAILGHPPEAMLGQCIWDVFPGAADLDFGANFRAAMETQQPRHFEAHYPPSDQWFECHCHPSPGELSLYFRDVSERRRAEAATAELKRRLVAALMAGDVATFEWKIDEDFLWGDPTFLAFFDIDANDASSAPLERFMAVLHPDDRDRVAAAIEHTILTGAPYEAEYRVMTGPNPPRWVIARGSIERDAEGRPYRFPGTVVDITERVRMEQALRASEARLREEDARKDRFLATLAHELRNPLAPLGNALALLRLAKDPVAMLPQVQPMMERQVDHLRHLVDDLLDLGRVTTGKVELRIAPVDLGRIVRHAVESAQPAIGARVFALDLPAAPTVVHGDEHRLVQIVGNLLQNASKFTAPDGHIAVRVAVEGVHGVVTVTDDGVGIPQESLEAIFEMFTQIPSTHVEARSGLGIGLALVKQLARLHGGDVEAWSAGLGRGARFTVRIPRAHAQVPAAPHDGSRQDTAVATGAGRRVLVVDDNRDAATSLAAMMTLDGWVASVAHDGEEALAMAAATPPDVVLMDLGMPRVDGYEACRRLRAAPGGHALRIVAVSGWGQVSDRRRSAEAGFDAHLVKPVITRDLQVALAGR
jgi:PAS domain S-box-containing protein